MNNLRNQVQLIGRIGVDTELKSFDDGKTYVNFSLATSERYKDKNGDKQEKTEWHKLVARGKTAELICEYCKKGDELAVSGKLTHRSYEKDGETRYVSEVSVNEILLMGSKEK